MTKKVELTDEEMDMVLQGLKILAFGPGTPTKYQEAIASAAAKVKEARKGGS